MTRFFALLALIAAFALFSPLSTASADFDDTVDASPSPDTPDAEMTTVIDIEKAARRHPTDLLEAASHYDVARVIGLSRSPPNLIRNLDAPDGTGYNPAPDDRLRRGFDPLPHPCGGWPGG